MNMPVGDMTVCCAFCRKRLPTLNRELQAWRSPDGQFFCNEFLMLHFQWQRRRAASLSAIPIWSLPNPKEAANCGGLKSGEERPEKGASSRPRRWTLQRGQLLCQSRLWHGLAVAGTPLLRPVLAWGVGCSCASRLKWAPALSCSLLKRLQVVVAQFREMGDGGSRAAERSWRRPPG
jgi:hypothetical protein